MRSCDAIFMKISICTRVKIIIFQSHVVVALKINNRFRRQMN
jgi:hypothetical protein